MNAATVDRLVERSARTARGAEALDWPERLAPEELCFSPEWTSLFGTPTFAAMDESARRRLAFLEAVNFFSLNLHGEGPLIATLARRRHAAAGRWREYEDHFLAEERKHTGWFQEFCRRYAGRVYPDRKLSLPRTEAPGEEELLFFAQALVFEEIVDAYDAFMARDERLAPIVRRIHALHHHDEARHRTFGRGMVGELWAAQAAVWPSEVVARVRGRLAEYLEAVWLEHYNPDVYRDAGLDEPFAVRREAWACAHQRARRLHLTAPIRGFLGRCGLLAGRGQR